MSSIAPRHLFFLLIITFIWGLNLVLSRIGLEHVPPLLFTFLRFLVIAILLAPFLRVVPGQMSALIVAGLLSGAISFSLLFAGLAMSTTVSAVAIAGQLGVPFTTLLSVALLGETVRWRRWLGITLSFGGVMTMGLDPQVFDALQSLTLVVASAFIGSLGLIAVKRLKGFKPLEIQAWFAWLSAPWLLAMTVGTVLYLRKVARETGSLVIKSDALHYAVDIWVGLGVLLSLVLVKLTGLLIIDLLVSVAIALYMLYSSAEIVRQGIDVVMDRSLDAATVARLKALLAACPAIASFHDFKTRAGTPPHVDFHVVVPPDMSARALHDLFLALRAQVREVVSPTTKVLMHADTTDTQTPGDEASPVLGTP